MTFIRAKEIPPRSGNWYDYEVKTVHEGDKVIQKHIRYIGKSSRRPLMSLGRQPAATFIETPQPARITKMKTDSKQIASALGMYYGGMSLDAIQQQFRQDYDLDMSESNYWNWIVRFTKEAVKQVNKFRPHVGNTWVADETYMKIGKRNVYFWDLIDADTRYLLATHVSYTRSGRDAKALMDKARARVGKVPAAVVTDKLKSYIVGIEDAFGAYSQHRQGGPFDKVNSTSLIERFHRTLEQRTKVFQKFKDIKSIRLLTDGWLINYNFFKEHEGCGNIPPAQAMSKVVPFKDWNDIVIPAGKEDVDYSVKLSRRKSVKKGYPVYDATLTPVKPDSVESA